MSTTRPGLEEATGLLATARHRHGLSRAARLATGGLVLVLLALTVFSVGAAVLTTRAAQSAQHSVRLDDRYKDVELALQAEEGLEHEYLFKGTAGPLRAFERASDEVAEALRLVRDVEVAEHRPAVDALVARHEQYRRAVPRVFALVATDREAAVELDEQRLEPLLHELRQGVERETREHRTEATEALAHLLRVQRLVLVATPVVFGVGLLLLGVFAAVLRAHRRELDAQAEENRRQALHDGLTGLPNRVLLRRATVDALARGNASNRSVALMLVDLDRFKEINDTLGHHYGDVVLQTVAARLTDALRAEDMVARLGGDEFAILLPAVPDVQSAVEVAARVREVLAEAVEADGVTLDVDASVGVALSGKHGRDVDTLLRHADIAMYAAKERGLGVCPYDPGLNDHSPERLGLLGELRRAIENRELVLHYQPKVALPSRQVVGVEALVRWVHPERGVVAPGLFVPVAERTALIRPFTRYVLSAALEQCRLWHDAGRPLQVAVNVSARNLLDETFVDDVLELLATWRVPPSALELEVTESAIMLDPERARRVLGRFAGLGITLSVDDFGAGYTSLAHLKDLPVHQLKIDRTFVSALSAQHSDAVIVGSIVDLGRALGLQTVAEGVEDEATLGALTALGCDVAQGYHLSRPLPAEQLEAWLRAAERAATVAA